ncbi:pirin family protein [Robiginitalea aurantiaca]|uniref:Pirin family protein n=1 Tax=Robiginitalea aurantiaca TaxID=3056915 RepID=A0ABT7WI00_9FLAO|nr:pirin family protein [Robiginitalea aurantiaca]MDM9632541.1 pirin family protein [Robiginitalea aurantiaca]
MKKMLQRSGDRGHANHGWLESYHSFSFANYYNPERMQFGTLRVLNDDRVAPGMGFGTHPHRNMEIISIPLQGDLEHKDSMGNTTVIREGDVQVMSAGTGVSHSEYNKNKDREVAFLQIWIVPNKVNVTPRYDQVSLNPEDLKKTWHTILGPEGKHKGLWVYQDTWFHMGDFQGTTSTTYKIREPGNGVYVFLLEGRLRMADETLNRRDALGIWDAETLEFAFEEDSRVLLIEVPMSN